MLWWVPLCPTHNIPLFPIPVNSSRRDDKFPVWLSEPPVSLNFLQCLLLPLVFLMPPSPCSIRAPDPLQTIRNLWALTLLTLLFVQTKTINIRLSFTDLDMQILCNYAKAVLLRISYFCFLQENLNLNYQSGCKCTISHWCKGTLFPLQFSRACFNMQQALKSHHCWAI